MSTDGFAKAVIDSLEENFSSRDLERSDDFTLRINSEDKSFSVVPNEEHDGVIDVLVDDEVRDTLKIPDHNNEEDSKDFNQRLTSQALYALNI